MEKVKLVKKQEIAKGTMAFYLEKPNDFNFIAGQHIVIKLIEPPQTDEEGDQRVFCLVNAPNEENLIVATRMRNTAFKNVLKNMEVGTEVDIDGPYGSFVLHNDIYQPAVFISGGIGITPFISMLRDMDQNGTERRIVLFYSNKTPGDASYIEELNALDEKNTNFVFIPTMTQLAERDAWQGERGFIDEQMLTRHITNMAEPIYYITGPPGFVLAMRSLIQKLGISAENVKTDQFSGY